MSAEVKRDFILVSSVLAGPIFWLISFQAKFSWTPNACATQSKLTLLVFSVLALVLTAASGLQAWRQWKELGENGSSEAGGAQARRRFVAVAGMVFAAGFCVVILAQSIPDLILGVCQ